MFLLNLENIIFNLNFLLLFLTTLFYFLQSAFLISSKWSFFPQRSIQISNLLQISFLGLRWFTSGHFPLSNLYESLLFLSWVLTTFLMVLNGQILIFSDQNTKQSFKKFPAVFVLEESFTKTLRTRAFFGCILAPLILFLNTFASLSLPVELRLNTSLVPALKSNWLMMHVTFMVLSYGALLCGCLFAIAFLIIPFFARKVQEPNFESGNSLPNKNLIDQQILRATNSSFSSDFQKEEAFLENLDNLSYRIIGFGFPLLTIGILSGAVWANQTWGSYWSWDPKETWALITWFVFAIYLHTRISHNWSGRQSAWIASFGFGIIWICYLGVNLLGKGLHSYGFLNPA